MTFARTNRLSASAPQSRNNQPGQSTPRRTASYGFKAGQPSFDIKLIADLLNAPVDYAAYAGIGSRETPSDVCADMTLIAEALERRGFALRSGFAGGADTAFELGTSNEKLREIFAPWKGFGSNPNSKWEKVRWDAIREWEANAGRQFIPAKALMLSSHCFAQAQELAAQYHSGWSRLAQSAQKLHTRNIAQVLGAQLNAKARFVIAWTIDGQDTGGTGQAIRVATGMGIPVLNLHDKAVRAEILRVLKCSNTDLPANNPNEASTGSWEEGF